MEKTKKGYKIVLPILLILVSLLAVFSFAGCDTSVTTLSETVSAMNDKLSELNFLTKDISKLYTREYYTVSYGETIDDIIESDEGSDSYKELSKYYSAIFSIAMSYFDENIDIVTGLYEEEVSGIQSEINDLNDKVSIFSDGIQTFATARNEIYRYFNNYESADDNQKLVQLRSFKRSYAVFVDNAVEMALSLTNAVEATGELSEISNVQMIKNSICTQLLSSFHEIFVMNIGTFNWSETDETSFKTEMEEIIATLEDNFEQYMTLLEKSSDFKTLTQDEIVSLKNTASDFLTEMQDFLEALDGLDLRTLAIDYYNNFNSYHEENTNAEVYLFKIKQFVNISLPNYLNTLYNSVVE